MPDPYSGREQTKAQHYILKRYLQELAFKLLHVMDITYVDGFSGPWECKTDGLADSSFMIAIEVLRDAQQKVYEQTGVRRKVQCFFSEKDPAAYAQLTAAVAKYHNPAEDFEITTYCGRFEVAIPQIEKLIGYSFGLVFIDPTGWTGYALDKIASLFARKGEVLVNFMYDFVNRAAGMETPQTVASLDPILGGPGWQDRLDPELPRGRAVEKKFREELQRACGFRYVVSTKIDRSTQDRPHFFIVYGTKSHEGLKAFRETERSALRAHARNRADAREGRDEDQSGTRSLFPGVEADRQEASIDEIVEEQKQLASDALMAKLKADGQMSFRDAWVMLLQAFMIRVTDVKDICVRLAKEAKIENTWGSGNRKPKDESTISLKS